MTELEPCPKCGKPVLKGLIHTECVTEPGVYVMSQMFDWNSEDGLTHITFDVTRMLDAIERGELNRMCIESPVDHDYVKQWLSQDVNEAYAMRLMTLNEPLLGVEMEDETVLLIDGRHRYWALAKRNREWIQWHVVPFPLWKPFAVVTCKPNPMEVDNVK